MTVAVFNMNLQTYYLELSQCVFSGLFILFYSQTILVHTLMSYFYPIATNINSLVNEIGEISNYYMAYYYYNTDISQLLILQLLYSSLSIILLSIIWQSTLPVFSTSTIVF